MTHEPEETEDNYRERGREHERQQIISDWKQENGYEDLLQAYHFACVRVRVLEEKVSAVPTWAYGYPDRDDRHWCLVVPDGCKYPSVMQWEPRTMRWHVTGGSFDPDRCRHLPYPEPPWNQ